MKLIALILFCTYLTTPARAEVKRHFSALQTYQELDSWQLQVEKSTKLNLSERKKELGYISRLRDRLDAESTSEFTLTNFKTGLLFLQKNSKKGANSLYISESQFIDYSLRLLDQLEPNEDPVIILKAYMDFASIENCRDSAHSLDEFEKTRTYINQNKGVSSDPDDLEEAANLVEQKIFRLQSSEDL